MTKQSTPLVLLLLCFTVSLFAQQKQYNPQAIRNIQFTERTGSEVLEERVETDTLLPSIFYTDECAFDQAAYGLGDLWGTVGGMNEYGDMEKAQLIENITNTSISITDVIVWFNSVGIVDNGNLRIKVYSVNEADGSPDMLLGQSDDIAANQIMVNDTFILDTSIPFSTPVTVDASSFFLSVDFSDLYGTMDTVDILHTADDCGSGAEAYELWDDGTWISMRDAWSSDTEDFDMNFSIFAVVEFDPVLAVKDPFYQQGHLRLHPATPNPSRETVRLNYELEKTSQVQIDIFSPDGRRIEQRQLGILPNGSYTEDVELSNFPAGSYIYSIMTDEARVVSRFIVN
ncbi:T9SS type A sorting domain-containing protein [Flavilitoribacter nigricans]|uniref:Secretion system C-terminal sorting domain-containing protein n=1 Tax=Flavilitoribacter nigricans (strain ATCC 23147 / DSM 23189 / NBRC 102662 / NCIMB 1420 / SS-2) TaxID=1122177 RepID=A0A2D0MWW0_FLAN2|nr:T9SS type A sorting domain-containing protein [Flavilitoribacter nigricans]PHN00687.1 hypothetical protein CRP01_40910 [Flavilitoribacter nigricans DSM 23189 = NBRC 102662]